MSSDGHELKAPRNCRDDGSDRQRKPNPGQRDLVSSGNVIEPHIRSWQMSNECGRHRRHRRRLDLLRRGSIGSIDNVSGCHGDADIGCRERWRAADPITGDTNDCCSPAINADKDRFCALCLELFSRSMQRPYVDPLFVAETRISDGDEVSPTRPSYLRSRE